MTHCKPKLLSVYHTNLLAQQWLLIVSALCNVCRARVNINRPQAAVAVGGRQGAHGAVGTRRHGVFSLLRNW